ncbi:MAG: AMP-binding protein [Planctomycetes bacterium]|nr:AMP-binding protein [Planctomycetota bacterium]
MAADYQHQHHTLQAILAELGDDTALSKDAAGSERGLRFCWHHAHNNRDGVVYTWPVIRRQMFAMAEKIRAYNLCADDVVVVHVRDQHRAYLAMIACIYLGIVPSAVAEIGKGSAKRLIDQFFSVINVAQPALIISDREISTDVHENISQLPDILLIDEIAEADACEQIIQRGAADTCFLQFTSGSTSAPKGVVVRHDMVLANCLTMGHGIGYFADERFCSWLPIYHDMGLLGYLRVTAHQSRSCFFPTSRFGRSPNMWMELMSEEKSQVSAGPNTAFEMVNRFCERRPPQDLDLSHVSSIVCGSEPIAAQVMRDFNQHYHDSGLCNGLIPAFGMAECTLMATGHPLRDPLRTLICDRELLQEHSEVVEVTADAENANELVACGAAGYGFEMRIVEPGDTACHALAESTVGELLLCGDSVVHEYYNNSEATAKAINIVAGKKWLRTGDIGFIQHNEIFICGRAADLIIHNGVNYHPADIERALQEHFADRVRGACVVDLRQSIADAFIGIGIYLEPSNKAVDVEVLQADAKAWVKTYTGLPIGICCASGDERIPRTTSGKTVRTVVKQLLRAQL